MEVLFVCSGNIVRSPLAEGLLRKILADIAVKGVVVASRGTLGIEGQPADPEAVRLARERGFELRTHRSRGLTEPDVSRADMIVVMEQAHLRALREIDPAAPGRARLLREFDPEHSATSPPDLGDPFGAGREALRSCYAILERCVINLAFHLKYRHGP